ncbi:MAG: hypothetical protein Q9220_003786 [cf. Caloplaca sp. 1 TL-2023]
MPKDDEITAYIIKRKEFDNLTSMIRYQGRKAEVPNMKPASMDSAWFRWSKEMQVLQTKMDGWVSDFTENTYVWTQGKARADIPEETVTLTLPTNKGDLLQYIACHHVNSFSDFSLFDQRHQVRTVSPPESESPATTAAPSKITRSSLSSAPPKKQEYALTSRGIDLTIHHFLRARATTIMLASSESNQAQNRKAFKQCASAFRQVADTICTRTDEIRAIVDEMNGRKKKGPSWKTIKTRERKKRQQERLRIRAGRTTAEEEVFHEQAQEESVVEERVRNIKMIEEKERMKEHRRSLPIATGHITRFAEGIYEPIPEDGLGEEKIRNIKTIEENEQDKEHRRRQRIFLDLHYND